MGIAATVVVGVSMQKAQSAIDNDWMRRLLARGDSRLTLIYPAIGALLVITILVPGREIVRHIDTIESWIANPGSWRVFVFITLFVLATSFLLPETVTESGGGME
jgi:hypothetical protein